MCRANHNFLPAIFQNYFIQKGIHDHFTGIVEHYLKQSLVPIIKSTRSGNPTWNKFPV